jgi:hypothetical protein
MAGKWIQANACDATKVEKFSPSLWLCKPYLATPMEKCTCTLGMKVILAS